MGLENVLWLTFWHVPRIMALLINNLEVFAEADGACT